MGSPTVQSPQPSRAGVRSRHTVAIFLVSLAGLLLEVGYTRVISYKLWYYYTYLVIGLALLGIGSGGIFVVVVPRLRRAATDTILAACSLVGAVVIAVGYVVVARIPIDTVRIWVYGSAISYKNLAVLAFMCFAAVRVVRRARRSSWRRCSAGPATASVGSTSPTWSAPVWAVCARSR